MYNTLKNMFHVRVVRILFTTVFLTAIFCGCALNKIDVDIQTNDSENETEIIHSEIPVIKGMSDEFCKQINAQLQEYTDSKINTFREEAANTAGEREGKAKLNITEEVKFNKKNLLSVVGEYFEYTSGMTGAVSRTAVNIDTESERRIYLCDLFNDEEYVDMLNARLEKISADDKYSDIWEKPVIGEMQNESFYFSDDGLVIYYPPYELSYYARGFVEFTVPYSELYGYLKPEYSVLY